MPISTRGCAMTDVTAGPLTLFVDRVRRSSLLKRLFRHRLFVTGLILFMAVLLMALLADLLAPHLPNQNNYRYRLGEPNAQYWFGTDNYGRDVLSRVIYGSRVSLRIAFMVVVMNAVF